MEALIEHRIIHEHYINLKTNNMEENNNSALVLTEHNIQDWKATLKAEMLRQYKCDDFEKIKTDAEWLEDYTDATVQDAIDDEVQYWEE